MKRELASIERSLKIIEDARRTFGIPLDPYGKRDRLLLYFTQQRADIANRIGRKSK
jgi:hypothetical protein